MKRDNFFLKCVKTQMFNTEQNMFCFVKCRNAICFISFGRNFCNLLYKV